MNWINFLWVWEVVFVVYVLLYIVALSLGEKFSKTNKIILNVTILAAIILGSILAGLA